MRPALRLVAVAAVLGACARPAYADAFTDGFAHQRAEALAKAEQAYTQATQEPGADAEVYYHLGLVEEGLGKPAAAADAYRRALNVEPASPFADRVRTNLGWALIDAGKIAAGTAALRAVAEARPDEAWALRNVAHALYLYDEDYNGAEMWYQRLVDLFPAESGAADRANLWLREAKQRATIVKIGTGFEVFRGQIVAGTFEDRDYGPGVPDHSIRLRTTDGDEVTIRKSTIRNVSYEPKYRAMGMTLREGADDRARTRFGAIAPEENLQYGHTLLRAGHVEAAAAQYRTALRKAPDSAPARLALAGAAYRLEDYREAARLFEACLAEDDTLATAHYYLVSTYANHLGDLRKALDHALAYIQLPDADRRDSIEQAAVTITKNLIAQHAGRPESEWTRAAGLQLDNAEHRRILGQAYLDAGEPGPALRHLGAAVEMWRGRGANPALAPLEQVLAHFEEQDTPPPNVRYYRGYAHFAAGNLGLAKLVLEKNTADARSLAVLALIDAYRNEDAAARAKLAKVDRNALPPPTRRLYDAAAGVMDAEAHYRTQLAERSRDAFTYARVGAANGLAVLSGAGEGDVMPIIVAAGPNGQGVIEVNGNPFFDIITVISFKEAFDWVENAVDATFPRDWDVTITFGGLGLYMSKGGDSAGCAIALALASAVTQQPVLQDVAVTGAIRLDGRVEPVGAVSEKVLGALANDIRTIVLPAKNLEDLGAPDGDLCSRVKFVTVDSVDQARFHAYGPGNPETKAKFEAIERRFRVGCRYYRLGAYALAREELRAVVEERPEVYSAKRLLELMGTADVGPILDAPRGA